MFNGLVEEVISWVGTKLWPFNPWACSCYICFQVRHSLGMTHVCTRRLFQLALCLLHQELHADQGMANCKPETKVPTSNRVDQKKWSWRNHWLGWNIANGVTRLVPRICGEVLGYWCGHLGIIRWWSDNRAPLGQNTIILWGPENSREAVKHFEKAPDVPHSHTKLYVRSKVCKFERARG